jgi:hypothetical protein
MSVTNSGRQWQSDLGDDGRCVARQDPRANELVSSVTPGDLGIFTRRPTTGSASGTLSREVAVWILMPDFCSGVICFSSFPRPGNARFAISARWNNIHQITW